MIRGGVRKLFSFTFGQHFLRLPLWPLLLYRYFCHADVYNRYPSFSCRHNVCEKLLFQNVVIFTLVPDYTMFGSQHYNQVQLINTWITWTLPHFHFTYINVFAILNEVKWRMNSSFSLLDWTIWPPERRHQLAHCALSGVINANDEGCYLQHCSSQNVVREVEILELAKSCLGSLRALADLRLASGVPRAHLGLWRRLLLVDLGSPG